MMSELQRIESAPQGVKFIWIDKGDTLRNAAVGYAHPDPTGGWRDSFGNPYANGRATHWSPLQPSAGR